MVIAVVMKAGDCRAYMVQRLPHWSYLLGSHPLAATAPAALKSAHYRKTISSDEDLPPAEQHRRRLESSGIRHSSYL
jgi:hypothetical protein